MFVLSCRISLPRHIIFGLPWSSSAFFVFHFVCFLFLSSSFSSLVCLVFFVFFLCCSGHPCYLIAANEGAVAVSSSLGFLSYAATLRSCSACISRLLYYKRKTKKNTFYSIIVSCLIVFSCQCKIPLFSPGLIIV